jgi:hypothetical protein
MREIKKPVCRREGKKSPDVNFCKGTSNNWIVALLNCQMV